MCNGILCSGSPCDLRFREESQSLKTHYISGTSVKFMHNGVYACTRQFYIIDIILSLLLYYFILFGFETLFS